MALCPIAARELRTLRHRTQPVALRSPILCGFNRASWAAVYEIPTKDTRCVLVVHTGHGNEERKAYPTTVDMHKPHIQNRHT